jgi:hypothetical protein
MASMLVGAGISSIGSLIGSGKQASAIKQAANTQAQAADYAANLQSQAEGNSLNFTKGVYSDAQGNESPFMQAGQAALNEMSAGTQAGGEFNSTPTGQQVLDQDPGYDFRLQQGQLALERAEAAGGGVGSGGALKAAEQYGQDYASGEYNNAFNRFLTTRQSNYSNLANIAGEGLSSTNALTSAGLGTANNISNTSLMGANAQGNYLTQGANATAAGNIGVANTQAGALSSIGTAFQQALAKLGQNTTNNGSGYANTGMGANLPLASGPQISLGNLGDYGFLDTSGDFGTAAA